MTAILSITTRHAAAELDIRRSQDVPEVLWSRVLAEWGTDGPDPAQHIYVPVERFLSQLDWLAPACRRHQMGIEWDTEARALVIAAQTQRSSRQVLAAAATSLDADEVQARLAGGRFSRVLKSFQVRDLGRLLSMPNGANFSVPGAGKTSVAYALYEAERLAKRVGRLLVVAPLSAFDSWIREAKDCFSIAPEVARYDGGAIPRQAEVCLVNYQRLAGSYGELSAWVRDAPSHVILDEAHRMKRGWTGEWGRASLNLAYFAVRRDVLSGTPAPQSFRDLEALFDFAWPGQARQILPPAVFERSPPADAAARVAIAITPYFVRTTKSELSLRAPKREVVQVPLEGLQRDIYKALRDQYAGQFPLSRRSRTDFAKMGEVVMYLLEAATNPALLPAGGSQYDDIAFRHPPLEIPSGSPLTDLLPNYAKYETPRKFVELAKFVKANSGAGRKTLIWTNFVRNIVVLEKLLARYRPAIIHGGIPSEVSQPNAPRTRETELSRFRTSPDCMVLIANPAATSEGVSLHRECHEAIYVDRTFNAGQYLQSIDRIHRLGMDPEVETRIRFLVTDDTIDQVVDRRIAEKVERLGEVLSDADVSTMSLPDDEDYGPAIDTDEDLVALFSHLRGES
ncbi:MAG TPA: DEAD/DEAH box helicase [Stellaceae bacterium]|nr:DEAD/DEAH box helicase [Stellaceae bacterium]